MSDAGGTLELARCDACHTRFLPTEGPCPRCGSRDVRLYRSPALGVVLAATEVTTPAEGWKSPHRLAIVEMPQQVRLLAIVDGPVPAAGDVVAVRRDGEVYRARTEPGRPHPAERGEGESPDPGRDGPGPFEPPR
jgi:uncharacterized OB-fold protein